MLEKLKEFFQKEDLKTEDIADILMKEQEAINELYEKEGLTDEVLERQVALNQKRHELDIRDKNNVIYEDFVQ